MRELGWGGPIAVASWPCSPPSTPARAINTIRQVISCSTGCPGFAGGDQGSSGHDKRAVDPVDERPADAENSTTSITYVLMRGLFMLHMLQSVPLYSQRLPNSDGRLQVGATPPRPTEQLVPATR